MDQALKTDRVRLLDDTPESPSGPVVVPDALAGFEVEQGCAADYDELLVAVSA